MLSEGLTSTPYAGLGFGQGREVRLGRRLGPGWWQLFSLGVETPRYEAVNGDANDVAQEHRIGVESSLCW